MDPFHPIYEIIITRMKFDVNRKIHDFKIFFHTYLNFKSANETEWNQSVPFNL